MKKLFVVIGIVTALCACDKVTADFTWEPAKPKAGEGVYFVNLSDDGEKWEWSFGDGATSTSTNPTKVFKTPGTFTVSLRVDGKNSWFATHQVSVTDTIPYFALSDTTGLHYFQKNTFSVVLYNPYSYSYTMHWEFPDSTTAHITDNSYPITQTDSGQISVEKTVTAYFSSLNPVHVRCTVKMFKEDTARVKLTYVIDTLMKVQNVMARSLLMDDGIDLYRQRIFELGLEAPTTESYRSLTPHDTIVDNLNNKMYYIKGGTLYCANLGGSNPQVVDNNVLAGALCLDSKNNKLYWGTTSGVKWGHLATNPNNKVTDVNIFAKGIRAKALELDETEQ